MFGASYKVIGGTFGANVMFANKTAAKKHAKGKIKEVRKIKCLNGKYTLQLVDGWGGIVETESIPPFLENVSEITEIEQGKGLNMKGAVGWGLLGGVATGGIGLLAGAFLGGRGKKVTFSIRFKDGSYFICLADTNDYLKLLAETNHI